MKVILSPVSQCSWLARLSITRLYLVSTLPLWYPSNKLHPSDVIVHTQTRRVLIRTVITFWFWPSISRVNIISSLLPFQITLVQAVVLGISRIHWPLGGVVAMIPGTKRAIIHIYNSWDSSQGIQMRVTLKMMRERQRRTIVARRELKLRARKVAIEERSFNRIRWIKHKRLSLINT